MGMLGEGWFVDTFQNHSDDILYQFVVCRWYAQWSAFAVCFRDVLSPDGIRLIVVGLERPDNTVNALHSHTI